MQRRVQHDHGIAAHHGHVVNPRHRLDAERLEALFVDTPEAPSQIWLALAAVSLPFSAISLTFLMPSRLTSKRMPSSILWVSGEPSARVICSGMISSLNLPPWVAAMAR